MRRFPLHFQIGKQGFPVDLPHDRNFPTSDFPITQKLSQMVTVIAR
jgi:hypothetical protein